LFLPLDCSLADEIVRKSTTLEVKSNTTCFSPQLTVTVCFSPKLERGMPPEKIRKESLRKTDRKNLVTAHTCYRISKTIQMSL